MTRDVIIIGAGVTGLSASMELKENALIIEKDLRAGGLVKTHCFGKGYWFDHVLHILHFKNAAIQAKITELTNGLLKPCKPVAWIECNGDKVLYPFQLNLGALNENARKACIADFVKVNTVPSGKETPANYRQYLNMVFGDAMCELFYYPYNIKLYRYPLERIAVDELTWNLHRPSINELMEGVTRPNIIRETYNTNAFYPIPAENASQRGMELLVHELVKHSARIDYKTTVKSIDVEERCIKAERNGMEYTYHYSQACLSTIPLPNLVSLCSTVPGNLLKELKELEYVNVLSVALSIKGPRPVSPGHWRYYPEPSIPFTRLIFMTEFDPGNAPSDGWGLMAEVTYPAKEIIDKQRVIEKVIAAVKYLEVIDITKHQVIDVNCWTAKPAYVIFNFRTKEIIHKCHAYLRKFDISSLGRYGCWEYSSMYQNIHAGIEWSQKYAAAKVL